MNYTITISQQHLLAILNLLQTVPAPMNQTYPIYEPLLRQMQEQDAASALSINVATGDKPFTDGKNVVLHDPAGAVTFTQGPVFVDDDMSADDFREMQERIKP